MGFPTQFGLLAQEPGFGDWTNILVVAVMAALWLLGALVKTISKKGTPPEQADQGDASKERRRPRETWQERLVRKAEEMQRRIEEEAGLREPGKPPRPVRPAAHRPPQAPGGKITIRSDSKGESVMVYEPPQPQSRPSTEREHHAARQREAQQAVAAAGQYAAKQAPPVEMPIGISVPLEPVMEGLSGVMAGPAKPSEPVEMPQRPTREPAGFEVAAVIDYSDPDALKKAVLHYEILGRPLALRDTLDQMSLF